MDRELSIAVEHVCNDMFVIVAPGYLVVFTERAVSAFDQHVLWTQFGNGFCQNLEIVQTFEVFEIVSGFAHDQESFWDVGREKTGHGQKLFAHGSDCILGE